MIITQLTGAYSQEYEDYLKRNEQALLYYSLKYKDYLKFILDAHEDYYIALEGDSIKGILPLLYKDGKFGRVYNSLPFYGSNGGIIADDLKVFNLLIEKYNEIITQENVCSSNYITNPLLDGDYSKIKHDVTDKRIGMFTPLKGYGNSDNDLISSFHKKTRNSIRKAEKINVKVEIDNSQIDFLKKTHTENMKAVGGKPKREVFFKNINKYFEKDIDYEIYTSEMDNQIIAAVLLFYYNGIVEYYTPAVLEEFREYQPISFIIYNAMLDKMKKGFRLWNWGGTMCNMDSLYRFKKRWNSFERNYSYYTKLNNESLYDSTKEELINEYNDFYVLPFNLLKKFNF